MDISGFTPPYICMVKGCQREATVELERENPETNVITRDLRLCPDHADAFGEPGTTITIER